MATEPQRQDESDYDLDAATAAYFRQQGREQAVWTPAALEELVRIVDAAPRNDPPRAEGDVA